MKAYKIAINLLILLIFVSGLVESSEYISKLDPALKPLILNKNAHRAPMLFSIQDNVELSDNPVLNTIIKVSGNPSAINSSGANIRSIIGDIITADVPLKSLTEIVRLPEVVYVRSARQMQINNAMRPALDISVPETKADQVWKSTSGYTGRGVIVGIIDTGIDWKNPDFVKEDGTTRILYIWDQTINTPARFPEGYRYGTEWTKSDIDSGICLQMDVNSHGTHVASIAAGNGRNGSEFIGMAPEADIIVVKTNFDDAYTLDAANYIFRKAQEQRKPAVINMSFGSLWGPRDGTDFIDQALNNLLDTPGRAITASAGNDGGSNVHAGTSSLRQSVGGNYPWLAINPLIGARLLPVEVWYPPLDMLSVRLLLPENDNGDLSDLGAGWVNKGESRVFTIKNGPLKGAEVIIDAAILAPRAYQNFNGIYIQIYDNGDASIPIDDYYYAIEFDGYGSRFDAYLPYYGVFTNKIPSSIKTPDKSLLIDGDGDKTILSPSSAKRVVCVSSYITKTEWIDSENRIRSEDYLKANTISAFSSRGPLINGERKPDISAPGEFIVADFSSDGWERPRSIYRDGTHVLWRGTSMSSPHVAGAIALLFQRNPNLSALEIINILNSSAIDQGPVGWDKAWGYGKLNVLSAMNIPSTPKGFSAKVSDKTIILSWLANEERNISGYRLYINSTKLIDVGNVTSYRLNDLSNGIPVSLSLSAYNSFGNEGPKTSEIIAIPESAQQDKTPPAKPENLTVVNVNEALILKWQRNKEHDLSGYYVYYGTVSGKYDKAFNVGNVTSYTISSLTNGQRVYAAISAYDFARNESEKSEEISAIPQLFTIPSVRYQSGWPVKMDHDVYSSPTIYDVDGDGYKEVAISSRDGKISLLRYNGKYMIGWPVYTGTTSISSPALCDINGDNIAEVISASGEALYVFSYDGKNILGWPQKLDGNIIGSPSIDDINGDGKKEIIIGTKKGKLYVYDNNGILINGFPVTISDGIFSSAAIGDIDGDYKKEIVVCSYSGSVYAFNNNGFAIKGWPTSTGNMILSSPVLGDIDNDGSLEVVVANSGGSVYAWRYDGEPVSGFPVNLQNPIGSSPAIGDIDGDNRTLEIVIGTKEGLIYVLKNDGSVMNGWPIPVIDRISSSPALADIDDDGNIDIIVTTDMGQRYIGLIYAFNSNGKKIDKRFPIYTDGNIINSSPAISDIDGDGDIELIVGTCRQWDGTGGYLHAWDLTAKSRDKMIVWGGFQHDPCHTGTADDNFPPSFMITVLQNMALKKYFDIYIIASEPLRSSPTLKIELDNDLIQLEVETVDITSGIYRADYIAKSSGSHNFIVSGIDMSGNFGQSSRVVFLQLKEKSAPSFSLLNNYPNPFNPATWIPFELASEEKVCIKIYNSLGLLIRTLDLGVKPAGSYINKKSAAYWDGRDENGCKVASGIYFYVLEAGKFRAVKKMSLIN